MGAVVLKVNKNSISVEFISSQENISYTITLK